LVIAGYAVGVSWEFFISGYEYTYLKRYLEYILENMRKNGFLGRKIAGHNFDFEIEIKSGQELTSAEKNQP
jgi:NADH:ubiquinone oxidoreductase subunit F (NADH-binding)